MEGCFQTLKCCVPNQETIYQGCISSYHGFQGKQTSWTILGGIWLGWRGNKTMLLERRLKAFVQLGSERTHGEK